MMPKPEMTKERENARTLVPSFKELRIKNESTAVGRNDSKKTLKEAPGVIEARQLEAIHVNSAPKRIPGRPRMKVDLLCLRESNSQAPEVRAAMSLGSNLRRGLSGSTSQGRRNRSETKKQIAGTGCRREMLIPRASATVRRTWLGPSDVKNNRPKKIISKASIKKPPADMSSLFP
jgi:hypothetical protein